MVLVHLFIKLFILNPIDSLFLLVIVPSRRFLLSTDYLVVSDI